MLLLAIDTSTSAVTVSLHDGSAVLATATTVDARRHTELVAQGLSRVLAQSDRVPGDVTQVVVGVGPGPFTGLRVGLVSARAFGFAVGAPVGGVCSLDVLAHQAVASGVAGAVGELVVATDARRREVYTARYALSLPDVRRTSGPDVAGPQSVAQQLDGVRVVGRGALLYPDLLDPSGLGPGPLDVDAGALASLAVATLEAGGALLPPDPLYLRRPDVSPATPRKPVLP